MHRGIARLVAGVAIGFSLAGVLPAQADARLQGGPKGVVKSSKGELLEGMMVQLIAQKNAVRTTVYTNAEGRYEFPALDAGSYTLRIALPREFKPFVKEGVEIKGPAALADITLDYVTNSDLLPPRPEIAAQMTGSEWLLSLSGTGEEKKLLTNNCNWCHSYQQIFRNHYDEAGWGKIVYRMIHGAGSPLININERGRWGGDEEARLVKWLASVRGPDSKDPSFVTLPRPQGRQTRVVITEYELPRLETATHDVSGDSKGNLWYSTHRSSYVGRLDPRTGAVKEFHVPPVEKGVLPGTHWIYVDKNDIVWGSENWAHSIWRLDPKNEQFTRIPWKVREPANTPMGGNYAIDPEGFIWKARARQVTKVAPLTGEPVISYVLKKFAGHLWQRHEPGRALFRRRRLAARRRRGGGHQGSRGVRTRYLAAFRSGARRVRPAEQLLVGRSRRHAGEVRHHRKAHPRIPAADALCVHVFRPGRQERRSLGRRNALRPLPPLQSEDRRLHRIRAAGALRHRPRDLDRQFHRSRDRVVCRPRGLAGAHSADGLTCRR